MFFVPLWITFDATSFPSSQTGGFSSFHPQSRLSLVGVNQNYFSWSASTVPAPSSVYSSAGIELTLTYNLCIICFIGSGCLMLPSPVSTHGSTAFLKIRIKILSAHLSSIKILHIIRNLFLHCIAKRISKCAFRHACHYIKFLIAVTYIYQWFCHFLKGVFPGLKFFFQLLYFFFVFIIFTCITYNIIYIV